MVFKGQGPVTSKIVIHNKITEQVNSFNYLRNLISYEKEIDIDKLNNNMKIHGIINDMFRPQKTKENKSKIIQSCQLCYTVVKIGQLGQQTRRKMAGYIISFIFLP